MAEKALMHRLAELVAGYAGLRPPEWVLAARVADRMRALQAADLRGYLRILEAPTHGHGGARELAALAEALRVGETRFFRHKAHISALRRVVVPELAARRAESRRVKGWSAGCATGEEAYTLAILLADGLPAGFTVDIHATDISDDALGRAALGRYPRPAIANLPEADRQRWFRAVGRGARHEAPEVEVSPELRAMVRFERRNLCDPIQPRGLDIILCRNVLIYFDADARARVIDRLVEALDPGGFLFLGYAETLRGQGEPLEALRTADGVVYQKSEGRRAAPARKPKAEPRRPRAARPAPSSRPRTTAKPAARALALSGSYEDAGKLAEELAPLLAKAEAGAGVRIDLDGAAYLGDDAARVLLRARSTLAHAGARLELRAQRPAIRRFCQRHGLDPAKDGP